ncbi:hypothetical protein G5C51_39945 [Streptomyces sp. A7024]|uniref:Uncharacterized protein n=1 Tax=Streptomyces coryli TaxID=1128680 RepID=A0A6G4UEN1_9ACTN|nr:hypothetical protein [Streptomyces coryli]NGN70048.1 hypothetical protein [Streptomyces coryli]
MGQPPVPGQPYTPGQPYAPGPPPPGSGGGGGARRVFGGLLAVFGVLGLLGGGLLIQHAYSNSRQEYSNDEYGAVMWRNEPADKLFPDHLGGSPDDRESLYDRKTARWNRVGIAPGTDCDKALTEYVRAAAKKLGCKAVLRATYADPTGNMVATVAIVVLPEGAQDEGPKDKVHKAWEDNKLIDGAVTPYAVPGTIAAKFENRNGAWMETVLGEYMPYTVGASIGSADGYVAGRLPERYVDSENDQNTDRDAWHANAKDLTQLFATHMLELRHGDLR